MLDVLSKLSYREITLCDVEIVDTIKDKDYEQIFCFGSGVALVTKDGFKPIRWYFVLPKSEPPPIEFSVPVGVVLGENDDAAINRSWLQWCKKAEMPWARTNDDKSLSISRALNELFRETEKVRRRKS